MMKKILNRIKIFISENFLDYSVIETNINNNKILQCYSNVSCGKESKFYIQANVINLQGDKNKIKIGINSHIRGTLLLFAHGGNITIGNNSYIGFGTQIWSANDIKIGNSVLISHNCNIFDTNSHEENYLQREESFISMIKNGHPNENTNVKSAPILIEDNVWISFGVTILRGVTIGKGAIVGAGAVVTKNVEDYTVVAGNPAVVVKYLPEYKV